ncbi:hypothetical protein GCM10009639_45380 [Kitasatospora putterlickiae]|uniref:Extracellular repeat, HAF family n=1 Tax=Kitasatospora putterlickiae TaxID=221725 RepID=A0ABN1YBZ0_9ACTN
MTIRPVRRTATAVAAAALSTGALLGAAPAGAAPAPTPATSTTPAMAVLPTGVPGKSYSDPTGVNRGGVVVGYAYAWGQGVEASAIRWAADGTPATLPPLPGEDFAQALGVNDANLAIGVSWPAGRTSWESTAVRWAADGAVTALPPLPGDLYSRPTAIGGSGIVVGTSYGAAAGTRAVAWRPDGTTVALAPLPGDTTSEATGVNAAGLVIGRSYAGIGAFHGIVWRPDGTPTRFQDGPTAGSGDWPVGINDAGTVIGVADRPTGLGSSRHGLVRSPSGTLRDLGANTLPTALNASGAVVGQYQPDPDYSATHAARWSPDGTLTPLPRQPQTGGRSIAVGINDSGTAIGYSWDGIPARQYQSGRIWASDGTLTDLDPSNTAGNTTLFVNDSGLVVGLWLLRSPGMLYPTHLTAVWRP